VFPESGTNIPRESLPSNEAWATVASQNEIEKKLGLQNYWSYTGFNTGSGTGYINVSNGNLSYITTDIVVSDPFFAMVMRRTYNSLAETKTPMGYGWDFSFNTCLLKEYNSDGTVKAMILKDGDGSFHYFEYKDGEFQPAKGTFMKLKEGSELNEETGKNEHEYQITRKDNIVYHFDAESLKLKSFSDNNGNEMIFTYDNRGNLETVENTVGEKIELTYKVEGAAPGDSDYTYVNHHPDMLESVTWTEGGVSDPVSITYYYDYNADNDKLEWAYTEVENNNAYGEEFTYNEDKQLITISDPEYKKTDISYDGDGRVSRVTDAINDYYAFSYDVDENNNPTTIVTNKNNVGISYNYDGDGLVTKKTDALGHSINYTYGTDPIKDQFLVTSMSYDNKVNGTTQTISYSYTYELGNIKTITAPDGTRTEYGAYNSFNKPLSVTVSKGTEFATTHYDYEKGNLTWIKDPEGKETTNTYDPVNGHIGYLTQVEGDFGNQTRYSYDTKGRVVAVKEYNNGTPVQLRLQSKLRQ
jgi:YD repeat-containing protein